MMPLPIVGGIIRRLDENRTTAAVQQYLDELARVPGDSPAEPIVRELLTRAVDRLHLLCARLLHRNYPRLTRGPLNLHSEEMLSAVVERLIKAMRNVRPQTVRQFFALANQHMRWELNDLARRLDQETAAIELRESRLPAPASPAPGTDSSSPQPSAGLAQILAAIEELPEGEREVFNLVRVQGMTQPEAAKVVGCSAKTVQRRLNRSLVLLGGRLGDMGLAPPSPEPPGLA
jgi:RNA polymerase sigma factor (sigma-70 family)